MPAGDALCVAFNQDAGCFAAGTDCGFRIFNAASAAADLKELARARACAWRAARVRARVGADAPSALQLRAFAQFRRESAGGVAICEMLFRCNLLALVGGGAAPKYPPNKARTLALRTLPSPCARARSRPASRAHAPPAPRR
jgi:hypothetical protein